MRPSNAASFEGFKSEATHFLSALFDLGPLYFRTLFILKPSTAGFYF